jgi:hypothetical protein
MGMNWQHDFADRPRFVDPVAKRRAHMAFWRGVIAGGMIVASVFIAGSAFAGDTAEWGGTGCKLVLIEDMAHVAEVRCKNVHTFDVIMNEAVMTAGDVSVHLVIFHGPGDERDLFLITPAPGYLAEPAQMMIREWDGETALIFPFVGS